MRGARGVFFSQCEDDVNLRIKSDYTTILQFWRRPNCGENLFFFFFSTALSIFFPGTLIIFRESVTVFGFFYFFGMEYGDKWRILFLCFFPFDRGLSSFGHRVDGVIIFFRVVDFCSFCGHDFCWVCWVAGTPHIHGFWPLRTLRWI